MFIECPTCHRKGEIPDRFGLSAHFVRCRTCLTRFTTIPLVGTNVSDHAPTRREDARGGRKSVDLSRRQSPITDDSDDFDDSGNAPQARGPSDSHYEWPGIDAPDDDDSQVELPAFSDDESSASGEMPVFADSASEEISIIESEDGEFARSRVSLRFAAALLLRAGALAVLGFFVFQAGRNSQTVGSLAMALAAVSLGLVGLFLLDHDLRGLVSRLISHTPRKPALRSRP